MATNIAIMIIRIRLFRISSLVRFLGGVSLKYRVSYSCLLPELPNQYPNKNSSIVPHFLFYTNKVQHDFSCCTIFIQSFYCFYLRILRAVAIIVRPLRIIPPSIAIEVALSPMFGVACFCSFCLDCLGVSSDGFCGFSDGVSG